MEEIYEVICSHWGPQLREAQAKRQKKKADAAAQAEAQNSKAALEVELVVLDDDAASGDLESMEARSLEQAEKGIVIEDMDMELLASDDPYQDSMSVAEPVAEPEAEKAAEQVAEPKVDLCQNAQEERVAALKLLVRSNSFGSVFCDIIWHNMLIRSLYFILFLHSALQS